MDALNPSRKRPEMALIYDACCTLAHEFPGGLSGLSERLGKSVKTLSNELNPGQTRHKLGLGDAVELMRITRNYKPLQAVAAALNHTVVYLGDVSATSDTELLNTYAEWHREIGDVAREVAAALQDGLIEREEYLRVRKEGMEQIHVFFQFLARLEALIDA